MQAGGFSPQEYLNSIISSVPPPPALTPANFATLSGHKIGLSEPKFSLPGSIEFKNQLVATAQNASIQRPVSVAHESHEAIGGEIQKTNQVFHEKLHPLTQSEIAAGEQALEELAKDEEAIVKMAKEENAHEKETIDDFDPGEFNYSEEDYNTFVQVQTDSEVAAQASKDNDAIILANFNKTNEANPEKNEKLSLNQRSYSKFEELTKRLAESDKLKLKDKDGELVLKKMGFFKRVKNFFSTNRSKSAQGYIKNFLDIAQKDIKDGKFMYVSADGKAKNTIELIKEFEKTGYANILRSHNESVDSQIKQVKEEAKSAKEKILSKFDRTIDLPAEIGKCEPSENVGDILKNLVSAEKTYNESLSRLTEKNWILSNGQTGNFLDKLLEEKIITAEKHKVIASAYENANNQATLFWNSLVAEVTVKDPFLGLYSYLNTTVAYMKDYLDSREQVEEIYDAEVSPLIDKLGSGHELHAKYREKNKSDFASDMFKPIESRTSHDEFLESIAKDPSLSGEENANLVKYIDNTIGYIRAYNA